MSFTSTKTYPSGSIVTVTGGTFNLGNIISSSAASSTIINTQFSSPQFLDAFVNGAGLQRAIGTTIGSGVSLKTVTLPIAEADTSYTVFVSMNYSNVGYFVSSKSTSAFQVTFLTAPLSSTSQFDYLVIR